MWTKCLKSWSDFLNIIIVIVITMQKNIVKQMNHGFCQSCEFVFCNDLFLQSVFQQIIISIKQKTRSSRVKNAATLRDRNSNALWTFQKVWREFAADSDCSCEFMSITFKITGHKQDKIQITFIFHFDASQSYSDSKHGTTCVRKSSVAQKQVLLDCWKAKTRETLM